MRYDNDIHLKLYLFDKKGFVSSSNLTQSGFENSVELTSTLDERGVEKCKDFFNKIYDDASGRQITLALIQDNYPQYLLLKKRAKYKKPNPIIQGIVKVEIENLHIDGLVEFLFKADQDFSYEIETAYEANKDREYIMTRLKSGFRTKDFYVRPGDEGREETLYYKFMYGKEGFLAGTGLREKQVQQPFEHERFKEIMSFIYPPIIGMKDWDLEVDKVFREYCNGIFVQGIPQYAEALPIRLASYFYPSEFLPIFKLSHLERMCNILGLRSEPKTKGDKLYTYNRFLLGKMKSIPYDNYVKSKIVYQLFFTVELHRRLATGEFYEDILNSYRESWRKDYIKKGMELLVLLKKSDNNEKKIA